MTRGRLAWVRRLSFAAVLIAAAVAPGAASGGSSAQCPGGRCEAAGTVRWVRALPGSWVVQTGTAGTTPVDGQAYAALGDGLAAVGSGMLVSGYSARTGQRLWTTDLTGFRPGAAIMSVRAWPGVITVGVGLPAVATATGAPGTAAGAGGRGPARDEVVLRASTGHRVRVYPAAQFGGAVAASTTATVIVGPRSVASYANRTGRVIWARPTGPVPQAWQVDGGRLYMAEGAGVSATALRRIDLRTGAERMVRARGQRFTGVLSLAFDGVALFADATGVRAYSETTGNLLWHYRGALPDTVDAVLGRFYLTSGDSLIGVDPATGHTLAHVTGSSSGLYAVREGSVLGIDHGALGKAWGYDVAAQQVLWTSRPLPWPHYFVDLSGIGGSAPPSQDAVLLAVCGQVGAQASATAPPRCARPELVLINR